MATFFDSPHPLPNLPHPDMPYMPYNPPRSAVPCDSRSASGPRRGLRLGGPPLQKAFVRLGEWHHEVPPLRGSCGTCSAVTDYPCRGGGREASHAHERQQKPVTATASSSTHQVSPREHNEAVPAIVASRSACSTAHASHPRVRTTGPLGNTCSRSDAERRACSFIAGRSRS